MATYNPFTDFNENIFTKYQYLQPHKVELKDSFDNVIDISDWASNVLPNGNIIASPNTPEAAEVFDTSFLDKNAETHVEPSQISSTYKSVNTKISGRPQQAVQFFVDNGYTINQAKGIVGNLMHESGDPTLNNTSNKGDGGDSFGIAQWHDTSKGVGRWTNLKNWAKENGKSEKDFETQLEFVLKELKDNPYWDKGLKATTTINGATKWFMEKFENPKKSKAALSSRLKYANSI